MSAEEGSISSAPFTLTYRALLADGRIIPPGNYSAALDEQANIIVFDAAGERHLYTLRPFMVDRLSRHVDGLRVVVEEGPGRPTYIRVYLGRRGAYFREFELADSSCGCCD